MSQNTNTVFKIVLLGEGGVGKTSLIKKYVYQKFDEKYIKTLGTNISTKELMLGPKEENLKVTLQIWDVLGQRAFQAIIKSAFKGAQGIMFVCDLTNPDSLKKLDTWVNYAYEFGPRAAFAFMANKSDLPNKAFGLREVAEYASRFKAPAYLTSAKSGEHVEDAFVHITRCIYMGEFAPSKDKVCMGPVERTVVPANVKAEDHIINLFCTEAGDYNVTMPIIRQHFAKHNIDFEDPTKDDLQKVIDSLTVYIKFIKGEEAAHDFNRRMKRVITDMACN